MDITSLTLTSAVLAFALFLMSSLTWLSSRGRIDGTGDWFLGFSLIALGIGMLGLGNAAGSTLATVGGNWLVIAGVAIKAVGFARFLGADPSLPRKAYGAVVLVALPLLAATYLSYPEGDFFTGVTSVAYLCFGLGTIYYLVTYRVPELKVEIGAALAIFVAYSGLYTFRLARVIYETASGRIIPPDDSMEADILLAVTTLLACIAVVEMQLMQASLRDSLRRAGDDMASANRALTDEIVRRTMAESRLLSTNEELASTQREILVTLSEIVEFRSKETAQHVARVGEYSRFLGLKAGLSDGESRLLGDAAPMHDIGKISIADDILNKPGALSADEAAAMRSHTVVGHSLLYKSQRPLLRMAASIALEHHEYWDGSGYPYGKRGAEISLAGRVVYLCDVFDALLSPRPYKEAWDMDRVLAFLASEKGRMFDPELADIFLANTQSFIAIAESMRDEVRA